tara:strand:- start:614 stop:1018 length:405 start_codon:yes stop_codon:yes gene_type:complete
MEKSNSTNNIVWLFVIALVIATIIVLVIVKSDDHENDETQNENNKNILRWVLAIGIVGVIIFVLWSKGYISTNYGSIESSHSSDRYSDVMSSQSSSSQSPSRGSSPSNLRSSSRGVRTRSPLDQSSRGSLSSPA